MKKAIAAIIALALCVCALTACSGKGEEKGTVPDLTGSWIETNTDSDAKMSAEITSDIIEVYWSSDETHALYWSGKYVAPTEAGTYTWSSVNDHDKTDSALLASGDDTKDFTYNSNGEITFDVTAFGVTKTVHLAKE